MEGKKSPGFRFPVRTLFIINSMTVSYFLMLITSVKGASYRCPEGAAHLE
jgi:hypothetical protein